ncbi:hypothetical protein ACPWT1_08080 [Ramlibacter sp. MMS24-I3-19]|uniref:hypothetical protein n=1 Tax=Ramlibacter sp. MMS24-I3-19 TaxID=3416606 RepID=UPI003CFBF0C4
MLPLRFSRGRRKSAKDRPVLEAVFTAGEAAYDLVVKDELLEAVPFASIAFKVLKARDTVGDRLFAAKLIEFLRGLDDLSPMQREQVRDKLLAGDDGARAGQTLLLVVDRLNDFDKARLLGFLVGECGTGALSLDQLRRLAAAVDAAFVDDLEDFLDPALEGADAEPLGQQQHRERLVAAGLIRVVMGETIHTMNIVHYDPTDLGTLLQQVVWNSVRA